MTRTASPTPKKVPAKTSPTGNSKTKNNTINFYEALRHVQTLGARATKLEWNNQKIYMAMNGDTLSIMLEDGLYHPLLVTTGDIIGTDWVMLDPLR